MNVWMKSIDPLVGGGVVEYSSTWRRGFSVDGVE